MEAGPRATASLQQPSPPFRLAEALSRFDSASEKISWIRTKSDALLDALETILLPNFQEKVFEESLLAIDSDVKETLQKLRTVGKEIESYGSLGTQASFDPEKRLAQSLPLNTLVHPDGTILQYAWKNLITNQSLARVAERSNNALKSFSEARMQSFPLKRSWPSASRRVKAKSSPSESLEPQEVVTIDSQTERQSKPPEAEPDPNSAAVTRNRDAFRGRDEESDDKFSELLSIIESVSSIRSHIKFELFDHYQQAMDLKAKFAQLTSKKPHRNQQQQQQQQQQQLSREALDHRNDVKIKAENGNQPRVGDDPLRSMGNSFPDKDSEKVSAIVQKNLSLDDELKARISPSVLIVTLPNVMKAILCLVTSECVCVKAAAVFGVNEIGSHVHAYGVSSNQTFSKLSIYVNNALQHFQKTSPQNSLQPFLIWFGAYISLFKEKCQVCDKLLGMDPSSRNLFPPLIRPYNENIFPLHFGNDPDSGQSLVFRLPKLQTISLKAFHVECFPSSTNNETRG